MYKVICAATIGLASITVLTQLILLPWIHQHTANLKSEFESRLRKFHVRKLGKSIKFIFGEFIFQIKEFF
jgi:hypothetical protein